MRATRARALRSATRPNPGRKHGGAGKVRANTKVEPEAVTGVCADIECPPVEEIKPPKSRAKGGKR